MQTNDEAGIHGVIASRLQSAVLTLDDDMADRFIKNGYETAFQPILVNIQIHRESYPGLLLACSTASVAEPVPVQFKQYVYEAYARRNNDTIGIESPLAVDVGTLVDIADQELDKCLLSRGDLARFLEWFMSFMVVNDGYTRLTHSGPLIPRFRGYSSRYKTRRYKDRGHRFWMREPLPIGLSEEAVEYIQAVERPFMDKVVIGGLIPEDFRKDEELQKSCAAFKALSEWIWRAVVSHEQCEASFHAAIPNRSGTLLNLYGAAVGADYDGLDDFGAQADNSDEDDYKPVMSLGPDEETGDENGLVSPRFTGSTVDPEEDESDEDYDLGFETTSPTLGLGMLLIENVQQAVLLGLRASASDYLYGSGKPFPSQVVKFLISLDSNLIPEQQRLLLDFGSNNNKRVNDVFRRAFESLSDRCIEVAAIADVEAGPAAGEDLVIDAFRSIRSKRKHTKVKDMVALAENFISSGAISPVPIRFIGEEFSNSIDSRLVSLCDYVWEKATSQPSLRMDPEGPFALDLLDEYEIALFGTAEYVAPAMLKPKNVQELVALAVVKMGKEQDSYQAMTDYPFSLQEGGRLYNTPPDWDHLVAQIQRKGS